MHLFTCMITDSWLKESQSLRGICNGTRLTQVVCALLHWIYGERVQLNDYEARGDPVTAMMCGFVSTEVFAA